jgi:hypothetical protein
VAREWFEPENPQRDKLIRHALRTLVKQGHAGALDVLGYREPDIDLRLDVGTPHVQLGETLRFSIHLDSHAEQKLLLDYVVHHVRANGSLSPKVFKWTTRSVDANQVLQLERRHVIRAVTTRKYYPGTHRIEIQVNGRSMAIQEFDLAL